MVKRYRRRKGSDSGSPLGNVLGMGVTNLVGVGMIGATADMVQTMPAGTAKTIAGNIPAIQSVGLLGANLGMMGGSKKSKNSWV